jgi:hypothetical protein
MVITCFNTCAVMNSSGKCDRGGFKCYDYLRRVQDATYKRLSWLRDMHISCLACLVLNTNKTYGDGPCSSIVIHPPLCHLRFLFAAQWPWQCSDVTGVIDVITSDVIDVTRSRGGGLCRDISWRHDPCCNTKLPFLIGWGNHFPTKAATRPWPWHARP